MDMMNSVLIEGTLVEDPKGDSLLCRSSIEHVRNYRDGEEMKKNAELFEVRCKGTLADSCGEYLKKGRGVRVIGRLCKDPLTGVFIHAEHVEFKAERSSTLAEVNARRGHEEEVR